MQSWKVCKSRNRKLDLFASDMKPKLMIFNDTNKLDMEKQLGIKIG